MTEFIRHQRRRRKTATFLPEIRDGQPLAESSHKVELKQGWDVLSSLSVEKTGGLWYVHSVQTPEAYRGQGYAKRLLDYVERRYGEFVVRSENDPFWEKMGFHQRKDGYWARAPRLLVRKPR